MRQNLTQRGLAHSTIMPTMLRGVDRERNRDLMQLADQVGRTRAGFRSADTGRVLGIISSRTDAAPNPGLLASLSQQLGQGGGGGFPWGPMMGQLNALRPAMGPMPGLGGPWGMQAPFQGGLPGPALGSIPPHIMANRAAWGNARAARLADRRAAMPNQWEQARLQRMAEAEKQSEEAWLGWINSPEGYLHALFHQQPNPWK